NTVSDTGMLAESDTVELLNYVVVGIIAVFAGIMVVTTVTAAIVDRERELSRLRLVGVARAEAPWAITGASILAAAVGAVLCRRRWCFCWGSRDHARLCFHSRSAVWTVLSPVKLLGSQLALWVWR